MASSKSIREQWEARILTHVRETKRRQAEHRPSSAEIVNQALRKIGQVLPGEPIPVLPTASQIDTAKRGRHGERTTIVDGIKFRSKLEADRYRELKNLRRAGEVKWFLRQVPFDVSVSVVYRLDFLVCWNRSGIADETLTYEETKGHLTDASRIKIGVVQERYAIKIKILRRADVSR
jgi:hypothetical protein